MSLFLAIEAFRLQRIRPLWAIRALFLVCFALLALPVFWPMGSDDFSAFEALVSQLQSGHRVSPEALWATLSIPNLIYMGVGLGLQVIGWVATWAYACLYVRSTVADATLLGYQVTDRFAQEAPSSASFVPLRFALSLLGFTLLFLFSWALGLVSLLIPGLVFTLLSYFAVPYLAYGPSHLGQALRKSVKAVRGRLFFIFAANAMLAVLGFLLTMFLGDWFDYPLGLGLISAFTTAFISLARGRLMGLLFVIRCLRLQKGEGGSDDEATMIHFYQQHLRWDRAGRPNPPS